jgi:hypothetical protein
MNRVGQGGTGLPPWFQMIGPRCNLSFRRKNNSSCFAKAGGSKNHHTMPVT